MKTTISGNLVSDSSKGMVTSAYLYSQTWYLLLDKQNTYSFEPENDDEKQRLDVFFGQLLVGGYVSIYKVWSDRILKVFDMVNQKILEVEESDITSAFENSFFGKLTLKAKEAMCKDYNIYTLQVVNDKDKRQFKIVADCQKQKDLLQVLSQLQVGYLITIFTTPKGEVSRIDFRPQSLDMKA